MSYVKEVLKILLGALYFAKLSFSEVDDYFLFFCIQPLRLPGAVPNRRYRLKIYCAAASFRLVKKPRCRYEYNRQVTQSYAQECVRGCYLVDGIDFCWMAGMWGVYFLIYRFMGCETGKTTNMNGLWIDRWYMRQDWIRPALAAAAITSLFYAENCKKNQTLSPAANWRAEHLELNYEFLLRWKSAKKYRL